MVDNQHRRFKFYHHTSLFLAVAIGICLTENAQAAVKYPPISNDKATFQDLGFLGTGENSRAFGVSPNGKYIAGWSWSVGVSRQQAFLWSQSTGMVPLGDLPGGQFLSEATDVSDNGVAIGTSSVGEGIGASHPFRWTQEEGMISLGTLGGSEIQGSAEDISADGRVIVGYSKNQNNTPMAFRWTRESGMVELGKDILPEFSGSYALGVSSDGTTIVGFGGVDFGGWRWREGSGFEPLGRLSQSNQSIARATSSDGSVVVGQSGNAFLWTAQEGIGDLGKIIGGPNSSRAFGVTGNGEVVVGDSDFNGVPFIWDAANHMRNLQDVLVSDFDLTLPGWKIETAQDISADGKVVVGWAIRPDGLQSAYRLVFEPVVPEPSTLALGVACLSCYFACNRSRG